MAKQTAKDGATQTQTKPKFHPCKCMLGTRDKCPEETTKAFARGHDARMSSRLATAIAAGKVTNEKATTLIKEAGGSDLLVSKTLHSAKLRIDKAAAKDQAKAEREKAKKEKAAAPAAAESAEDEGDDDEDDEDEFDEEDEDDEDAPSVSVGTKGHVKDGDKTYAAVVIRDAGGELVARHRRNSQNCDHTLDEFTAA